MFFCACLVNMKPTTCCMFYNIGVLLHHPVYLSFCCSDTHRRSARGCPEDLVLSDGCWGDRLCFSLLAGPVAGFVVSLTTITAYTPPLRVILMIVAIYRPYVPFRLLPRRAVGFESCFSEEEKSIEQRKGIPTQRREYTDCPVVGAPARNRSGSSTWHG